MQALLASSCCARGGRGLVNWITLQVFNLSPFALAFVASTNCQQLSGHHWALLLRRPLWNQLLAKTAHTAEPQPFPYSCWTHRARHDRKETGSGTRVMNDKLSVWCERFQVTFGTWENCCFLHVQKHGMKIMCMSHVTADKTPLTLCTFQGECECALSNFRPVHCNQGLKEVGAKVRVALRFSGSVFQSPIFKFQRCPFQKKRKTQQNKTLKQV